MAQFQYVAMDAKGKEDKGIMEAMNENEVLNNLREQGMFPVKVVPLSGGGGKSASGKKAKGKSKGKKKSGLSAEINLTPSFMLKVSAKELSTFTRQMSTLINAGMPLVRSLQVLKKQEKNTLLRDALQDISESIEGGSTFAEALGNHPKIFNNLFVNMAKAGEVGGILDQVLLRLAEFMEKAEKIKSKVKSAMVYPSVVMVMAVGIVTFLMVVIIPKFQDIFNDLLEGEPLPGLTQAIVKMSKGLTTNLIPTLIVVILVIVGVKMFGKTKAGRKVFDTLQLHYPLFGTLFKKTAIARFARTLGTLMSSGVPVLQALTIVRDTAGNVVIADAVNQIHDAVKEGENMAPPMEATKQFPPLVVSMVQVGEETGDLPEMLVRVADNFEDEVDDTVSGLTSIIEPILIVFLAVVVGTIVIALFLPLMGIISKLS